MNWSELISGRTLARIVGPRGTWFALPVAFRARPEHWSAQKARGGKAVPTRGSVPHRATVAPEITQVPVGAMPRCPALARQHRAEPRDWKWRAQSHSRDKCACSLEA